MELSTRAITLTATDYRENDKILQLYSLELGRIAVTARGIKKATAKNRFAQEPFCFGTFELVERNGYYVMKTCVQEHSFYNLREDIEKFVSGCVICETIARCEPEEQPDNVQFVSVLRYLEILADSQCSPLAVAVHFLMEYALRAGYQLDFKKCTQCGNTAKTMYIDIGGGGVCCENCKPLQSLTVSQKCIAVFNMLKDLPLDKLKNVSITANQLKDCLKILDTYFQANLGNIKSISQLIKL